MNNNSSKQILLSVIGVAILVVAVVGVSFAFFSYTKEGTEVSKLGTGTISFNMTDGVNISITDAVPLTDAEGIAQTNKLTFTVTGYSSYTDGIDYSIYVVSNNDLDGDGSDPMDYFGDLIKLQIKPATTLTSGYTVNYETDGDGASYNVGGCLTYLDDESVVQYLSAADHPEIKIASGNITNTSSTNGGQEFEVRVWLADDKVLVSNTAMDDGDGYAASTGSDPDGTGGKYYVDSADEGKYILSEEEFNNKTYKLKIKVVAEDH